MPDKDVDKIDTVDFDQNDNSVFLNQAATVAAEKPSPWVWIGLGGLLLLALLVIFVLPSVVSDYELPLERRADLVETPTLKELLPRQARSPHSKRHSEPCAERRRRTCLPNY